MASWPDLMRVVPIVQVQDAGSLKCVSYKEEGARKHRPHGLNTVELLKVASASLGIGPHQTMAVAERLYIQGFISYPRTESTKYPEGFNFDELLVAQANHPFWGHYVQARLDPSRTPFLACEESSLQLMSSQFGQWKLSLASNPFDVST
jgi:DNA topoisomerase IA